MCGYNAQYRKNGTTILRRINIYSYWRRQKIYTGEKLKAKIFLIDTNVSFNLHFLSVDRNQTSGINMKILILFKYISLYQALCISSHLIIIETLPMILLVVQVYKGKSLKQDT